MKFFNYSTLSAFIVAGALLSCNQPATTESIAEAKPEETGEIKVVSTLSFPDGKYIVDNGTSTCNWVGKEASGSSHTGDIGFHKGSISILNNAFGSAFVGINMNSINCTDLRRRRKRTTRRPPEIR